MTMQKERVANTDDKEFREIRINLWNMEKKT